MDLSWQHVAHRTGTFSSVYIWHDDFWTKIAHFCFPSVETFAYSIKKKERKRTKQNDVRNLIWYGVCSSKIAYFQALRDKKQKHRLKTHLYGIRFKSSVYFNIKLCDGCVFIENHCSNLGTSVTGSMNVRLRLRRSSRDKFKPGDMPSGPLFGTKAPLWFICGM